MNIFMMLYFGLSKLNSQYSYNAVAIKFLFSNCLVKCVVTGVIAHERRGRLDEGCDGACLGLKLLGNTMVSTGKKGADPCHLYWQHPLRGLGCSGEKEHLPGVVADPGPFNTCCAESHGLLVTVPWGRGGRSGLPSAPCVHDV